MRVYFFFFFLHRLWCKTLCVAHNVVLMVSTVMSALSSIQGYTLYICVCTFGIPDWWNVGIDRISISITVFIFDSPSDGNECWLDVIKKNKFVTYLTLNQVRRNEVRREGKKKGRIVRRGSSNGEKSSDFIPKLRRGVSSAGFTSITLS